MKSVIKKQLVRANEQEGLPAEHADVTPAQAGERCKPKPKAGVRLVRLDGRVAAVEFTCRCGETSVLELEYEPQAGESSS